MTEETPKKAPAKKAAPKKAAAPDQGQATRTGPSARTPADPETPPDVPTEAESSGMQISQWEFVNEIPTRERVLDLLATLPDVWGVSTIDFADYVQVLPQTKKVKVPHPSGRGKQEVYLDCFTCYMSVAGRLKMLEAAADANGWRVEFTPTPFLFDPKETGRLVYREVVEVWVRMQDGSEQRLGSRPGMAWVPWTGGSQAAGSNPFEKVETAARGRALAAWGFGVLPGSGVASVEEVLGAAANERAMQREAERGQPVQGGPRVSREELLERVHTLAEQIRQIRQMEPEQMADQLGNFLSERLAIKSVYDAEAHQVDWQKVADGNLHLLANSLADGLRNLQNQEGVL